MLYSWGANGSGQLGLGDEKDGLRPAEVKTLSGLTVNCAAAGAAHTLVTTYGKEGSKTWAFGSNSCGQLAVGAVGDGAKITTPTPVPSLSRGTRDRRDRVRQPALARTVAGRRDMGNWMQRIRAAGH